MTLRLSLPVFCLAIAGCVSAQKAYFYHPVHGVVNGEDERIIADGNDCAMEFSDEANSAEDVVGVAGEAAKFIGLVDLGNAAIAAALASEGKKLVKHQSTCMSNKGWSRVEEKDDA